MDFRSRRDGFWSVPPRYSPPPPPPSIPSSCDLQKIASSSSPPLPFVPSSFPFPSLADLNRSPLMEEYLAKFDQVSQHHHCPVRRFLTDSITISKLLRAQKEPAFHFQKHWPLPFKLFLGETIKKKIDISTLLLEKTKLEKERPISRQNERLPTFPKLLFFKAENTYGILSFLVSLGTASTFPSRNSTFPFSCPREKNLLTLGSRKREKSV